MHWCLYLALKQLFPTGKRLSFFAFVAIIGVMLGVMVLLIVMSVMNGFSSKLLETVQKTYGDIKVNRQGAIFYDWEPIEEKIKAHASVKDVAPYAEGILMMLHEDKPLFPAVRAIELEKEKSISPIEEYLVEGSLEALNDQTILLGKKAAATIGAQIGSLVEVYTPLMLQKMKEDEILLPKELTVVGTFETGMSTIDENLAILPLRLLQELYGMEGGVHGFSVKIKPSVDLTMATNSLNEMLKPHFQAFNWMQLNKNFLFVLRMEKAMMFFIIIFVILVASFSIASSLMTSVARKTREIGVLGALGGRPLYIAACFCCQALFVGIVGVTLGLLGGVIALQYRNLLVHGIAKLVQKEGIVEQFYYFSDIPAKYLVSDFVLIILSTLVISSLAGILPALRAALLKPSEALRNE